MIELRLFWIIEGCRFNWLFYCRFIIYWSYFFGVRFWFRWNNFLNVIIFFFYFLLWSWDLIFLSVLEVLGFFFGVFLLVFWVKNFILFLKDILLDTGFLENVLFFWVFFWVIILFLGSRYIFCELIIVGVIFVVLYDIWFCWGVSFVELNILFGVWSGVGGWSYGEWGSVWLDVDDRYEDCDV